MRRFVVGMALGVGCYSPSYAPGAPCETDCPGDLVCTEHVCREPGFVPPADAGPRDAFIPVDTIDGPPGDGDADGVLDSSDNCPAKSNVDQHDEDADAAGDVCDPCPHMAGTTDGDGDGVGDACDPQPAIAKQRIKFFDPFTSDLAEWTDKSSFSRVGETLRLNGSTSFAGSVLQIGNGESRIMLGGTIAAVRPAVAPSTRSRSRSVATLRATSTTTSSSTTRAARPATSQSRAPTRACTRASCSRRTPVRCRQARG